MKEGLIKHYEEKYEEERSAESIGFIPYRKYPVNRSEACVKYFTDNFQKEGTVLELGAGNGMVAKSILKQNEKIRKYLISDLSENRLEGLRKSIQDDRLYIKRIDVEDFNFDTIEKVDAVIMIALIEHLVDPLGAMKRIRGALKPGGFVYIDTPNIADYGARFKLLTGRFPSTASKKEGNMRYDNTPVTLYDEGHLHYFTYRSLSEMLVRYCGFTKTSKYYQMIGKRYLGKHIHHQLAKMWPEMFSSLILIAE